MIYGMATDNGWSADSVSYCGTDIFVGIRDINFFICLVFAILEDYY